MHETRTLAEFCADLSCEQLPEEVIQKVKLCILDYLANVYGALRLNAVQNVADYVRTLGGDGAASVFGCGYKTSAPMAAFVNGTAAEAIEAQDGLRFGGNHPGTAVISAAFAIAEQKRGSGRDLITAIVAGYEIANRAAAAMHPWHTLSGFLPTGTTGAFGAAAAAAKLSGGTAESIGNSIGNAGYILPLSMAEHLMGGYTIKIVQGGQAAHAGIMASGLSEAGLTGFPQVLEGSALNGGFIQITTRANGQPERLTENLGEKWSILDVYLKPHTACRHTHGAAEAILALMERYAITPETTAHIDVYTYGIAQLAVGRGFQEGDTFVSAQFSIPYVIAACVFDREMGPEQLTEKRLRDPALIAFLEKIRVHTDEMLNQSYPDKTATRVEVALEDGTSVIHQSEIPLGDPRNPMTEADIAQKVRRFAGYRDEGNLDDLIGSVLELEKVADISELTRRI